jgi:D-amino-acid dehydrogenase
MRVVVIGAGVVGLTTARALQEAGHEVVVVEAGKDVGQGTSYANGAQLSYGYVAPFAGPDVWRDLPRLLLSPRSPVRIRIRPDFEHWRWLASFAAACTQRRCAESTRKLLELAVLSRAELNAFEAAAQMDFDHCRNGKLVVYATKRTFDSARAKAGTKTVLTRAECLQLDPFLERISQRIHGAIFTDSDDTADCYAFCKALRAYIERRGSVVLNTRIDGFVCENGRAVAAVGWYGRIEGDAFVLANGLGAQLLGRRLGFNFQIAPLKGYSVTVPLPRGLEPPKVSVTEYEQRTVYAPLGRRLRIAGIADLVGPDLSLNHRRVSQLMNYARELTSSDVATADSHPWTGLRPATPSGLPIIGATGIERLFVNAGHGGFGFTLAMGSARLVQRALDGERTGFDWA